MIPFLRRRLVRRRNRRPSFVPVTQRLENRSLLTGVVSFGLDAATGAISIEGDKAANDVTVEIANDDIVVTGNAGTQIRIGDATFPADQAVSVNDVLAGEGLGPVDLENLGELSVKMSKGSDVLTILSATPVNIGGDFDVDLGTGSDTFVVVAGDKFTVDGDVKVDGDKGNNTIALLTTDVNEEPMNAVDATLTVNGSLKISGGRHRDLVAVGSADPAIDLLNSADPIGDFLALDNISADRDELSVVVTSNIDISTGKRDDVVLLSEVGSGNDIIVHTGHGHGDILVAANVGAVDDMKLTYGDLNALQNVSVGDDLSVHSGTGNDVYFAAGLTVGDDATIKLGSGRDALVLGDNVEIADRAYVHGGSSRDTLSFVGGEPDIGRRKLRSIKETTLTDAQVDAVIDRALGHLIGLSQIDQLEELRDRVGELIDEGGQPFAEAGVDSDSFGSPVMSPLDLGEISADGANAVVEGFLSLNGLPVDASDGVLFTVAEGASLTLDLQLDELGVPITNTPVLELFLVTQIVPIGDERFILFDPTPEEMGETTLEAEIDAGTYVIAVNADTIAVPFAYTLTLMTGEAVEPPDEDVFNESNDSFGSVSPINPFSLGDVSNGIDATFNGRVFPNTDESDLISFEVTVPSTVTVTVAPPAPNTTNEFGLLRLDELALEVVPTTGSFDFDIDEPGTYGVFIQDPLILSGGDYSFELTVSPQ